ncbi:hypothetical protein P4H66_08905 [Paenibacillus dokdonensis]|uniref:Uncharacterized protein n=1 Tax=Paenibacillus dokdonensis TaxID=2567944 RepID=A0ABU6GL64_9BACL|nr:hypothetical protein [Paenibacillus dokdonensis]MEC0239963.1 hypothetical protein [Paenibacillus dokdonensis]
MNAGISAIPVSSEETVTETTPGTITPFISQKSFSLNFNGDRTSDIQVLVTSNQLPYGFQCCGNNFLEV